MASYTTTAPGVEPIYGDIWNDFSIKVGPGNFTEAIPKEVPTIVEVAPAGQIAFG
jgi:hypothetical protein